MDALRNANDALKTENESLKLQNEISALALWFQIELHRIQNEPIDPLLKGKKLTDLSAEYERLLKDKMK